MSSVPTASGYGEGSSSSGQGQADDNSGGNGNNGNNGGGPGVNLTPKDKQIVGGVVGSIAGVAVLLLLVLMAVKYKKRRDEVSEILPPGSSASRRAIEDTPGSPSSPGGFSPGGAAQAPMAEQRSSAFSVPSVLAGLAVPRRKTISEQDRMSMSTTSAGGASTGETGFVRVSGRKLPSVLQHGGDGFSDPRDSSHLAPAAAGAAGARESYMSGESDYYRGSQAFEPASAGGAGSGGPLGKLALGSPMRPVSGVPVMRTGPAKTPITEQNPFEDSFESPSPPRAPGGRDLTASPGSDVGSRGSGSRFQEEI